MRLCLKNSQREGGRDGERGEEERGRGREGGKEEGVGERGGREGRRGEIEALIFVGLETACEAYFPCGERHMLSNKICIEFIIQLFF